MADASAHTAPLVSADGEVVLHCPPEVAKIPLVNHGRSFAWITDSVASICEE